MQFLTNINELRNEQSTLLCSKARGFNVRITPLDNLQYLSIACLGTIFWKFYSELTMFKINDDNLSTSGTLDGWVGPHVRRMSILQRLHISLLLISSMSHVEFIKWACRMSLFFSLVPYLLSLMSPVDWLFRPDEFKSRGPYFWTHTKEAWGEPYLSRA